MLTTPALSACALVGALAGSVHADSDELRGGDPPLHIIPAPLAEAVIGGEGIHLVAVGDSTWNTRFGREDGANHCPLFAAMHRTWWQPPEYGGPNWWGLYVNNGAGGIGNTFRNISGGSATQRAAAVREPAVGGSGPADGYAVDMIGETTSYGSWDTGTDRTATYLRTDGAIDDSSPIARQLKEAYDAGAPGGGGANSRLAVRFLLFDSPEPGRAAKRDLRARMSRASTQGTMDTDFSLPVPTEAGWTGLEMPWRSWPISDSDNMLVKLRAQTPAGDAEGTHLIHMGMIFRDVLAEGPFVFSNAQGGWTTQDHLRDGAGPAGAGYSDAGLRSSLSAMGFADPGRTPVVLIAIGINLAPGESIGGVYTAQYRENIKAIVGRYREALEGIGAQEPWIVLVNPHTHGTDYNGFVQSRGDRLREAREQLPDAERIAVVDLAAAKGQPGVDFPTSEYHAWPQDFHYSVEGATADARTIWDLLAEAAGDTCVADFDGDGTVDSADFFGFVAAFLAGDADVDGSGMTDSADFFLFVEAFLGGCL